jgi:hypothetical protein
MDKKQLAKEYMELHPENKRPYGGWSEEILKEKINEFKSGAIDVKQEKGSLDPEEKERMEEAYRINNMQHSTVNKLAPVWKDGKPYGIINDKYVPWAEAELIVLNNKKAQIEAEIAQLELNSK